MFVLTAVSNTSEVYILQKTAQYQSGAFLSAFSLLKIQLRKFEQANNPDGYVEQINTFLKGAKNYGVNFVIGNKETS